MLSQEQKVSIVDLDELERVRLSFHALGALIGAYPQTTTFPESIGILIDSMQDNFDKEMKILFHKLSLIEDE